MPPTPTKPRYFRTPAEFRLWLEANHDRTSEIWVGFFKKHTGKQGMSWSEAVDQALCFGWIDSVLHRVDDTRHVQRFTPRRPNSIWSKVNVTKVKALAEAGLMHPAGMAPFLARGAEHEEGYSVSARDTPLSPAYQRRFRANKSAWTWYRAQAASYQWQTAHWVMSAKREETRERRLEQLITDAAVGKRVGSRNPRRGQTDV